MAQYGCDLTTIGPPLIAIYVIADIGSIGGGWLSSSLIKRGWITFDEGTSENNRRAKFYRLTAKGRKQLEIETSKWDTLAAAVGRILRPATQEK